MKLTVTEKAFIGRRLIEEGPVGILKLISDWKPELNLVPLREAFAKSITTMAPNGVLMFDIVNFLEKK